MEIRNLNLKDIPEIKEIHQYCFPEYTHDTDSPLWEPYFKSLEWSNCLGCFVDDRLVCTWMVNEYPIFIRGQPMKSGAVHGVATLPEYRRKGYVKALLKESLELMREKGQLVSVLYPFKFDYYRKYGWETCTEIRRLVAKPENIRIRKDSTRYIVKEIPYKESFEVLSDYIKKRGKDINMLLLDQKHWFFRRVRPNMRVLGIFDDTAIKGYFLTKLVQVEGKSRLEVIECMTDAVQARLCFLEYVAKHVDHVYDFRWNLVGDEPVTDYLKEQWSNEMKYEITGGNMSRIIDVQKAMEMLSPQNIDTEFTLKIHDEYAEWNQNPLKVTIHDGKVFTEQIECKQYDLETSIQSFTQLYTGYREIKQLQNHNMVQVNPQKITEINSVFPHRLTRTFVQF